MVATGAVTPQNPFIAHGWRLNEGNKAAPVPIEPYGVLENPGRRLDKFQDYESVQDP